MINFPPSPTTGDPYTDTDGVLWICEDDTVGDVRWVRRGNAVSEANPIGAIINWAGATPPAGYLACDGSALKRATYPDLFAAIGVLWNNTGGAISPAGDEFRIPPQNVGGLGLFMRGDGDATVVGAYQADVLKEHAHNVYGETLASAGSATASISNQSGKIEYANTATLEGDPTETRPRSITTMLCIKATYSAYTGDMGAVPVNSVGMAQIKNPMTDPVPDWTGRVLSGAELTAINIVGTNPTATLWPDGSVTGSSDNGEFTKWANGVLEILSNALYTDGVENNVSGNCYTSNNIKATVIVPYIGSLSAVITDTDHERVGMFMQPVTGATTVNARMMAWEATRFDSVQTCKVLMKGRWK